MSEQPSLILRVRSAKSDTEKRYTFYCPGCKCNHAFSTPHWKFNEDFDKPTVSPSLLSNRGHPNSQCHLFIVDGKLQYLHDCHHELAGKTVDMEPL